MGEQITGNYDQSQVEAFKEMQEEGRADSYAEAARQASYVGLQQMGYVNGEKEENNPDTFLKLALNRIGMLMALAGMVVLALTFAYPVPARVPGFAALVFGTGLYATSEILEIYEPAVTKKLKGLFGGDPA